MGKIFSEIRNYHILTPKQQHNVERLNSISKSFSSGAKIKLTETDGNISEAVVIDSGHQPNFFPYPGLWKKAFLLDKIQKKLSDTGVHTIAYFGFADQNLSTAKILSKNQIPFFNKKGSEDFGFRIEEKDRYKTFCTLEKPSRDRWEKEVTKIAGIYQENANKLKIDHVHKKYKIDDIIEILWESYNNSRNFSELNSIVFAKICYEILGIDKIRFYTFSALTREKIFLDEAKEIILQQNAFNDIFNRTITDKHLDLRTVTQNRVPLWYHCGCGGKFDLIVSQPGEWSGACPVCKKEYYLDVGTNLDQLDAFYTKMDFSAVARNIIFANGMGSSLFLSGSGGALSYGILSDKISKDLGYYQPLTLSWVSRDYYFGIFQSLAIQELMKTFKFSLSEIPDGSFKKKITSLTSDYALKINDAKMKGNDEKTTKRLENLKNNLENITISAEHIFQLQPSLIDLFTAMDSQTIVKGWSDAIENAMVEFDEFRYKITKNVIHSTQYLHEIKYEDIPTCYKQIESIEVD